MKKYLIVKCGPQMRGNNQQFKYLEKFMQAEFKLHLKTVAPGCSRKVRLAIDYQDNSGADYITRYRLDPESHPVFDQSLSKTTGLELFYAKTIDRLQELNKLNYKTKRNIMHLSKMRPQIKNFHDFLSNQAMSHISLQIRQIQRGKEKILSEATFDRATLDNWARFVESYLECHFKKHDDKVDGGLLRFDSIQSFRKFKGAVRIGRAWVDGKISKSIPIKCESEIAFHKLTSNMSAVLKSGLTADFWIKFEGEKPVSIVLANFKGIPNSSKREGLELF
jgi:hypothetical protein